MSENQTTSGDFQKNFGIWKKRALSQPLTIMTHGKPTLVVLSISEFESLVGDANNWRQMSRDDRSTKMRSALDKAEKDSLAGCGD